MALLLPQSDLKLSFIISINNFSSFSPAFQTTKTLFSFLKATNFSTAKMQFSSLITILTVAMTAAALPAADMVNNNNGIVARTGGGGGTPVNECSNTNEKPICCTGGLLGIIDLSCIVAAVGGICSGNVKCCNVDKNPGQTLINVEILTCGLL